MYFVNRLFQLPFQFINNPPSMLVHKLVYKQLHELKHKLVESIYWKQPLYA